MSNLSTITKWMLAQVGTSENPKGSNNVVYNTHYYGHEVSGDAYPWCVAFLWAGFNACGLSRLFLDGGKTASVSYVMQWAKKHGQWTTSGYREGDLLCYGAAHIGYCVGFNGGTATAIEGNYGDRVAQVFRDVSEITGAFRPAYGVEEGGEPDWGYTPATDPEDYDGELLPDVVFPDVVLIEKGDVVIIKPGARWYDGSPILDWVFNYKWEVLSVNGDRVVLNRSVDGRYRIMSPISIEYLVKEYLIVDENSAESPTAPTEEVPDTYTVQKDDTLWAIAERFLGDGTKWPLIQKANNLTSTIIKPGKKLKIPKKH